MVLIIQEPEGWRCNECGSWIDDPYEHAKIAHEITDHNSILLVNNEDI